MKERPTNVPEHTLSVREAAHKWDVTEGTVLRWLSENRLPYQLEEGRLVFGKRAIEAMVELQPVQIPPALEREHQELKQRMEDQDLLWERAEENDDGDLMQELDNREDDLILRVENFLASVSVHGAKLFDHHGP